MNPNIPIPTDNIYKFYALFGLTFFIVCSICFTQIYKDHREGILHRIDQYDNARNKDEQQVIVNVMKSDHKDFVVIKYGVIFGLLVGAAAMAYGFSRWHEVQKAQDELTKLQLRKLTLDLNNARKPLRQR